MEVLRIPIFRALSEKVSGAGEPRGGSGEQRPKGCSTLDEIL